MALCVSWAVFGSADAGSHCVFVARGKLFKCWVVDKVCIFSGNYYHLADMVSHAHTHTAQLDSASIPAYCNSDQSVDAAKFVGKVLVDAKVCFPKLNQPPHLA